MNRWAAVVCMLTASLLGGGCCCSCPGDCVPVSMEGCYDFLRFYGPCRHEFPYSCPCCPYYSGVAGHHQIYHDYDVPNQSSAPTAAAERDGDAEQLPENEAENAPNPDAESE